jgi:secreted trypsin-like serine protease
MLLRIVICFLSLQNIILFVEAIFGGQIANPREFSWIVKLNMDNCKHKFCGGSIISENIILTAAHCVDRGLLDIDIPIL